MFLVLGVMQGMKDVLNTRGMNDIWNIGDIRICWDLKNIQQVLAWMCNLVAWMYIWTSKLPSAHPSWDERCQVHQRYPGYWLYVVHQIF